jgi:hypothetical protein
MRNLRAYEEVIEFIAAGSTSENVAAFRPSESARERLAYLLYREKTSSLSVDEQSELDHYLKLEHLMRLAKARARQYIPSE